MKTINTILEEFDKKIQERTLNEDNPQYVFGWNACRYLSRQFFCQSIKSLLDELVPKKYKKLETDSIEIKLHEALLEAGHKKCREELISKIKEIKA